MKRILVIDESEVIRETLALILGREFAVFKKFLGAGGITLADTGADVDLVIIGVNPGIRAEAGRLLRFAAQVPCAVLFLVESRSATKLIEERETIGCLAKPFNPYELKQKVGTLLARAARLPKTPHLLRNPNDQSESRYLSFPFLSRPAASLVRRYAATRLPVLISGELGCGQERVVRAMCATTGDMASCFFMNGSLVDAEYLSDKGAQWSWQAGHAARTLVVEDLDKLSILSQSLLLGFIEELEATDADCRLLATSKADLLERVYRGEFLESLYYRVATLTLALVPLRERRQEIPTVADLFASHYGRILGLGDVTLSAAAQETLSNYLWFGNVNELETVLARSLAFWRKNRLDAADLMFDFASVVGAAESEVLEKPGPSENPESERSSWTPPKASPETLPGQINGVGKQADLKLLIHELAHELKNPMVTIKTFAQLLNERYHDEDFRSRFQHIVGSDIERMDDLLEVMIEFADFSQSYPHPVSLEQRLRHVLDEVRAQSIKRQTAVIWRGTDSAHLVLADEDQLAYLLRNVLLAVLAQTRSGTEVNVTSAEPGRLVFSFVREGARVASIRQYITSSNEEVEENILPLRLLLAKQLVERNGGKMIIEPSTGEREILTLEFPLA